MLDSAQLHTFPVLETERLLLRELTLKDAEALFSILSDSDGVRFYDIPFIHIEQARRAIERHRLRFRYNEALRWAITLKSENRLLGNCGYSWDKDNHFAVLSYVLARPYWNQGIMTEALNAIIPFGFKNCHLHRIEADVSLPNIASQRVLQKLGFHEEGLRRGRFLVDGRYYDEKIFALLADDLPI
jgi:[ribosomal protein S5]-alanine N-acetyltransferase